MTSNRHLEPVFDSSEDGDFSNRSDSTEEPGYVSVSSQQLAYRASSTRVHVGRGGSSSTTEQSSVVDTHQDFLPPRISKPRHGIDPFGRGENNDPFASFGRDSSGESSSDVSTDAYPVPKRSQGPSSSGANPQEQQDMGQPAPTQGWFGGFSEMISSSVERLTSVVFGEQPSELAPASPPIAQSNRTNRVGGIVVVHADPYYQDSFTTLDDRSEDGVMKMPPSSTMGRQRSGQGKYDDRLKTRSVASPHGRRLSDASSATNDVHHGAPSTQIQFNVVAAIRQYRRNPVDALFSLVRTALTARSMTNLISGAELAECRGDNNLVGLVIQSIKLDYDDLEVQQELQAALESVLHSRVADRLPPESCDLLKVFFSPMCMRLTRDQYALVKRSGFEFVMLLQQFPHVLQDLPDPKVCRSQEFWRRVSQGMEPLFIIVSLLIIYWDLSMTCYYLYIWFNTQDFTAFQISLLVVAGGTFLSVVANKIVNSTREDDLAVYTKDLSDFPTVYLRVVPLLPLLETYTAFGALKHICQRKNILMRHDLAAMFTNAALIHSMFHSTQQILTQSYFAYWRSNGTGALAGLTTEYILLILSTSASIFVHPLLYLRTIVTNDSVNSMGFCFFGKRMPKTEEGQVSKFARVLSLLLVYLLQFNVFMLLVAVNNISQCSTLMITWIVIAGVSILITIVMFIYTMVYTKDFFKSSKWLVIPIILQLGYTIFISVYTSDSDREDAGCRLFFAIGAVNIVFGYIGWGILVVVVATWGIYTAYMRYQVKKEKKVQATQSSTDRVSEEGDRVDDDHRILAGARQNTVIEEQTKNRSVF